jgi:hypothetical protein
MVPAEEHIEEFQFPFLLKSAFCRISFCVLMNNDKGRYRKKDIIARNKIMNSQSKDRKGIKDNKEDGQERKTSRYDNKKLVPLKK